MFHVDPVSRSVNRPSPSDLNRSVRPSRRRSKTPVDPTSRPLAMLELSTALAVPGAQNTTSGVSPTCSVMTRFFLNLEKANATLSPSISTAATRSIAGRRPSRRPEKN